MSHVNGTKDIFYRKLSLLCRKMNWIVDDTRRRRHNEHRKIIFSFFFFFSEFSCSILCEKISSSRWDDVEWGRRWKIVKKARFKLKNLHIRRLMMFFCVTQLSLALGSCVGWIHSGFRKKISSLQFSTSPCKTNRRKLIRKMTWTLWKNDVILLSCLVETLQNSKILKNFTLSSW